MTARPQTEPPCAKDTRPFFLAWSIYAAGILLAAATRFQELAARFDFRNFYAAGYLIRTDPANLYNIARQQQVQSALISNGDKALPFVHPSYEALLYAPFSLLPYHRAYLCFLALNLLLLVVLFLRLYPVFSARLPYWQPRPGLMFFPFLAIFVALWHGQNSILFLLLCGLVWVQLERGSNFSAGCLLALGLFKFHVAIPLAILCAVRKGWRFTAGFAGTAAAVVTLCFALVGKHGMMSFAALIHAATLVHDHSAAAQAEIAVFPHAMTNLVGLLSPLTQRMPAGVAFVLVAAVSAAIFICSMYFVRKAEDDSVAFAIGMACAALVSYHMYISDEAIVLLPIALLSRRLSRAALAALYVVPPLAVCWLGLSWNYLVAIATLWMWLEASGLVMDRRVRHQVVTA